jgi:sugar lactone lactonase YvrE
MMAECIVDCRNTLGEGCVWDPRDESLYWTDIESKNILRLSPDHSVTIFPLPERAGFILPRRDPGFIIGFASRIAVADSALQNFNTVCVVEPELPQTRVNDAAVDPFGGLVFGTFDERDRRPAAAVYRLAPSGEFARLLHDVTIANGIAFSPDGATMYFADTLIGSIRRFRVGAGFLSFDEFEPLIASDVLPGSPDGAIVDQEGHYWSARVWGSCLIRIAPDGRVSGRIDLPTRGPTCVALGGRTGRRLFATTLRIRHTDQELDATPQAGGLFVTDVKVPGVQQRLCLL